jgi:hypothetical protein
MWPSKKKYSRNVISGALDFEAPFPANKMVAMYMDRRKIAFSLKTSHS